MLPDGLHKAYNRVRRALLVRGLIALALGIFILARPLESVAAFALVIAVWALVTGIDQIVDGVEMRSTLPHWWLLVLGSSAWFRCEFVLVRGSCGAVRGV